jgi:diaminopimelate epimerase
MKLHFTKMHGAGNDFVVIDAISQDIDFTPAQWKLLGDRRFGIGADQILVVEKPRLPAAISATASITTTAAKWSSAATARAPS